MDSIQSPLNRKAQTYVAIATWGSARGAKYVFHPKAAAALVVRMVNTLAVLGCGPHLASLYYPAREGGFAVTRQGWRLAPDPDLVARTKHCPPCEHTLGVVLVADWIPAAGDHRRNL